MEFGFKAEVVLTLKHEEGWSESKHVSTEFNMSVTKNLDAKVYLDEEEIPTAEGSKVLSNVLVQGLVGNIHMAHDKGFRDSAEHLRWIIGELERGFAAVSNVSTSTFTD